MKSLKEALVHKHIDKTANPFGLTEKDMIGKLVGFPIGVVVRMMEEQENQGNEPDIEVFQHYGPRDKENHGFTWTKTVDGHKFWKDILVDGDFNKFYEKYPEYKKYNI